MLNRKIAARLLLALALSTGAAGAWAQDAAAPAQRNASSQVVLGGLAKIALPDGFEQAEAFENGGMAVTRYQNPQARQAILLTDGAVAVDIDSTVLRGMTSGYETDQQRTMEAYRGTGKKNLKIAGFDAAQIDAQTKIGGNAVLQTSTFVVSGKHMLLIVVVSRPDDSANHKKLVVALQQAISANR
ncbi:hypothetical protein [Achromobacter sp. DH1f]|uniref:hypothetical protein n=1 Tax=Achromobacter sp. DH1f TaxID=1397275 RepID=UPI0004684247|nr:hypothetical protein [Achromobacter sp. DH1f]